MTLHCEVCFRRCSFSSAKPFGFCGGRILRDDQIVSRGYGRISSLALDPIEKKPLNRFKSGSMILSVGSYGCNLRCPFCQNSSISWTPEALTEVESLEYLSPQQLVSIALDLKSRGNIGVAFTYNEPLINYEYVRDVSALLHEVGLVSVLVTNGTASLEILDQLDGLVDAMNIDLKSFNAKFYRSVLGGDLSMVQAFIRRAVQIAHVELTTLIIPRENDSEEEIRQLALWIRSLDDQLPSNQLGTLPWHLTRFYPRFKMLDKPATDLDHLYHLKRVASEYLKYVF